MRKDIFANYPFECTPDCKDRKVGCRSGCERYARDVALRAQINEAIKKEEPYKQYACDQIAKNQMAITRKKNKIKTVGIHHK